MFDVQVSVALQLPWLCGSTLLAPSTLAARSGALPLPCWLSSPLSAALQLPSPAKPSVLSPLGCSSALGPLSAGGSLGLPVVA